jgi:hypothetical protein
VPSPEIAPIQVMEQEITTIIKLDMEAS